MGVNVVVVGGGFMVMLGVVVFVIGVIVGVILFFWIKIKEFDNGLCFMVSGVDIMVESFCKF